MKTRYSIQLSIIACAAILLGLDWAKFHVLFNKDYHFPRQPHGEFIEQPHILKEKNTTIVVEWKISQNYTSSTLEYAVGDTIGGTGIDQPVFDSSAQTYTYKAEILKLESNEYANLSEQDRLILHIEPGQTITVQAVHYNDTVGIVSEPLKINSSSIGGNRL